MNDRVRPLTIPASHTINARARRDEAFVREALGEASRLEEASELGAAAIWRGRST